MLPAFLSYKYIEEENVKYANIFKKINLGIDKYCV